MLTIEYGQGFLKRIARIKDLTTKERVKKHVERIIRNPLIGKPMRYARKGTREMHVPPYRLAYAHEGDTITFLDIYHKDEQ